MAGKISIVDAKPKKIEIADQPKRRVDSAELAAALGANPKGAQAIGELDPINLAELGTQLLLRLRSSDGKSVLADSTINCPVPLAMEDVKTLEDIISHIEAPESQPSVGELVSVIVRLHLSALKGTLNPAVSSSVNNQGMNNSVARSILQEIIEEQIRPIRERVMRLETELRGVGNGNG